MLWRDDQPEPLRPAQQADPLKNPLEGFGLVQGITPESANTIRPMRLLAAPKTLDSSRSGINTTEARASLSSHDGFMSPTIRPRRWRSHRQSAHSPKLRDVGLALGVSEAVAERRLYGSEAVNLQAAVIIAVLLRRGEVEDAATFEAPISAAMLGPVVGPMLDLQRSADESDGYEDVAEAGWIAEKSDEALAIYIRKLASDLYHGSRLLAALKAEQAKRADK